MCRFTLNLARTAQSNHSFNSAISISSANELHGEFLSLNLPLLSVQTFNSSLGSVAQIHRIFPLRRLLVQFLRDHAINSVVTVMPHVWTPLVSNTIRNLGIPHTVIVHDVEAHPGDWTGLVNGWLVRDALAADKIVTLSRTVADQLRRKFLVAPEKMLTLFHPDLNYVPSSSIQSRVSDPLRILFLGRIKPYKGLSLFVSAMELLQAAGLHIKVGVFGEGDLGGLRPRLERLNATLNNFWIDDRDILGIVSSYDVVAVSHSEASQSGVVALAFGHGLPVVATPVGGLREQVSHEINGLLADSATPEAFANQIRRLAQEPGLYGKLAKNIAEQAGQRSMQSFLEQLVAALPMACDAPHE